MDQKVRRNLDRAYFDHHRTLNDEQIVSARSLDKHILGLSGGALVLSLSFLERFIPKAGLTQGWLLALSWAAFGVAMILIVLSFATSKKAFAKEGENWDRYYRACIEKGDILPYKSVNGYTTATARLTLVGLFAFVVGVFLFTGFAACNWLS